MAEAHKTETFIRGDDWPIEGSAHDPDWTPINLSGAVIEWELRKPPAADGTLGDVVVSKTTEQMQITDAAAGEFRLVVPRADTIAIPPGTYYDQCRVTAQNGYRSTQWFGAIECEESFFEAKL